MKRVRWTAVVAARAAPDDTVTAIGDATSYNRPPGGASFSRRIGEEVTSGVTDLYVLGIPKSPR